MKYFILAIAAVALAACQTTTPEELAERRAEAAANATVYVAENAAPGFRACVPYAVGGSVNAKLLAASGFSGPRQVLGRPVYERQGTQVVLNDGLGRCRVSQLGTTIAVGNEIRTVLPKVLRDAGFTQSGGKGRKVEFSNGTSTFRVESILTTSYGTVAVDTIFTRMP